jgi:hypothetical protein
MGGLRADPDRETCHVPRKDAIWRMAESRRCGCRCRLSCSVRHAACRVMVCPGPSPVTLPASPARASSTTRPPARCSAPCPGRSAGGSGREDSSRGVPRTAWAGKRPSGGALIGCHPRSDAPGRSHGIVTRGVDHSRENSTGNARPTQVKPFTIGNLPEKMFDQFAVRPYNCY